MPDVAGGIMPGEAVADAQGPSASLQYGDRTRMDQLAASLKNQAPGAYAAVQPPEGPPTLPGGQPSSTQPAGGPPGGLPVQAPPQRQVLTPQAVDGQVFTPPQQVAYPHAIGLMLAAAHPRSGPYTMALAQVAARGFGRQQPKPQ